MNRQLFCIGIVIVFIGMFIPRVFANNVRLNGTVKVTDVTSGVATLELDLTWENSWRDNFNWDAVWLFLKFKPAGGEWSHVMLQDVTHTATNDYQVMNGKSGSNVTGVYVYLGTNGVKKNVSTKVTLKWACGSSYTKSSFDNNQVFLLAQGIEMVYIPFGAYYMGDRQSNQSFCGSDGNPLAVNGEGVITLYQRSADGVVSPAVSNLPAAYPKGYAGYYIMRYETSQEQYVTFLNTLTRAQQESLLGASFLSGLSVGRYIFGDTLQASYRNGIILSGKPAGRPYLFDNNLNGNSVYGEDGDGQCIACNYMSLNDVLAYASWSGLRPMSELEYERACRAPFPQEPLRGEYAWNTNSGLSRLTALGGLGKESEMANGETNVNSNWGFGFANAGPVRCGIFARSNSNQTMAGATYWGVMEMSGNVGELVANVANTGLSRTVNGSGAFNLTSWSADPSHYGLRGGSFAGADSLLRSSDRTQAAAYFNAAGDRDSTVGFRLTCSLDAGSVSVNPGTITVSAPLCPGITSIVSETAAATVSSNFLLSYLWSYTTNNGVTWLILPEETGNTLSYDAFESGKTYLFKRTVICALGEASAQTTGIAASASTVITVQPTDQSALCGLTISVTATGTSLTYQWLKDGAEISGATSATYTKTSTTDSDAGQYQCRVSGTCGTLLSDAATVTMGGIVDKTLTDPRDGKTYKTRIMPDGREWMVEDLCFGTCNNSTFNTYSRKSVKDELSPGYWGVCMESTQPGAGYLYNWQAAMNHPDAVFNTSGNPVGNSLAQWQGICPEGWHLPSGSSGEFQQLYAALCNQLVKIYPGIGAFEGVLGGYGFGNPPYASSVVDAGRYGFYWSSTYYNKTSAYALNSGANPLYDYNKSYGFAVRCVKNY